MEKSNSKDKDKEGGRSNNNQIKQLEQLRRDKIVESRLEKSKNIKQIIQLINSLQI